MWIDMREYDETKQADLYVNQLLVFMKFELRLGSRKPVKELIFWNADKKESTVK